MVVHTRSRRRRAATAVTSLIAVGAILAACDSGSTGSGSTDSGAASSSAAPQAPANPQAAVAQPLPDNAVDNALGKLDGLVDSLMSSTKIPGMAVAVVHGGKTVYAKGFGVKDVGATAGTGSNGSASPSSAAGDGSPTSGASGTGDNKVDPDTVFPLASMSKPIGSTVIAKQVTDNVVGWDTPVVANLPGFALSDQYVTQNVTVADMYSHRSGLPDHAGDKLEDMGYDRQQILARLRYMPLDPFRITYNYTNYGVTAAGESVARKAGSDWETLSENAIYGPLGMTHTSSRFRDFEAEPDRVVGHVKVDGQWVQTPAQRDPDPQAPAGGVSSSVNDVAKWLTMLLGNGTYNGKQIVDEKALIPAVTPEMISSPSHSEDSRAGYYGYGFNVSVTEGARTTFSHAGAFSMGAGTNFLVLPSADVAIVALSNASPIGAVDALCGEFADLVQFGEVRHDWRTLYGDAYEAMAQPSGSLVGQKPPANPAPAPPAASVVGTYQNDVYGPAVIREENGKLVLAMGPDGVTTHELTHWDGNTYTFTLRNENAELGSISKVTMNGPQMTIEYYDDDLSNGVFTRS